MPPAIVSRMIREAGLEALKGMSDTHVDVYQRIKRENPDIEITIRLDWPERVRRGVTPPSPEEFVDQFVPIYETDVEEIYVVTAQSQ